MSVPINESNSVGESIVDIVDAVPIHTREIKIPNEELRYNAVERTPSIQEEEICWFFKSVYRMLRNFRYKESSKIMTASITLILSCCLFTVPFDTMEISDVDIQGF